MVRNQAALSMPSPRLAALAVSLSYGGNQVIHDVSLEFGEAGSTAIMGPSGSGKTSLLYCLAGLEPVESGDVRLLGRSIGGLSSGELADLRLRHVGFVFQSSDLVPELTIRQNIALPLELAGTRRREVAARVRELLAVLDLESAADRRPNKVSGGQAQRCAVARAVVARPEVVFADEPTGALDLRNRDIVLDLLLSQVEEIDALLVAVTHDPQVAERFERQITLSDGAVVGDMSRVLGGSTR